MFILPMFSKNHSGYAVINRVADSQNYRIAVCCSNVPNVGHIFHKQINTTDGLKLGHFITKSIEYTDTENIFAKCHDILSKDIEVPYSLARGKCVAFPNKDIYISNQEVENCSIFNLFQALCFAAGSFPITGDDSYNAVECQRKFRILKGLTTLLDRRREEFVEKFGEDWFEILFQAMKEFRDKFKNFLDNFNDSMLLLICQILADKYK